MKHDLSRRGAARIDESSVSLVDGMSCYKLDWKETPVDGCRHGALTIGNFDGVHRGHAALVAELSRRARAAGGPAVVVTFDPHPLLLLRPDQFQPLLTTMASRAELLQACGADHVVVLRTERELLQLGAREFFERVVRTQMDARVLVEGFNFGFGRNREGNVAMLRALCAARGIELEIVAAQASVDGAAVSSSRVRSALVRGAVREAGELLGRRYRLDGVVSRGQRRGQTLGFPTANLEGAATLIPGDGVYAVRVPIGDVVWPAAAHIGANPTFGEQARKVEIHLIGFQGDLYGRLLSIEFLERLRDTRPFAGPDQLVEQLRHDVDQARRLAADH